MIFLTLFYMFPEKLSEMFWCSYQHLKIIEYFKIIYSSPYQLNPVKSSEHLVMHNLLYPINSLVQMVCRFSCLTILYYNIGFNYSWYQCLPITYIFHIILYYAYFTLRHFLQNSLFW